VVNQLKAYNLTTAYADGSAPLYPLTNAPVFSQHGGAVAAGFQLGISAPNGTIYYTTSGADPRAVGGAIAGAAYTGAIPIIQSVVTVKARVLNGAEWSAMTEATFFADVVAPSTLNIVFSEIHYHPAVASLSEQAAGFTDADAFEYIELMNVSTSSVNLTGAYFATGIDYVFPATVLSPGGRLTLARNAGAFALRYGFAPSGVYDGRLSNSGENLILRAVDGVTNIRNCAYGVVSPWPIEPDGFGPSLVLRNPLANPDHNVASNWRASAALSPGGSDSSSYLGWKGLHGITNENDDGDGDGLLPLLEYALGGSPSGASSSHLPTTTRNPDGTVTIIVRRALSAGEVIHTIEQTSSLTTPFVPADAIITSVTASGLFETWIHQVPATSDGARFFRVRFQAQ
jgi:hypothetical protein